MSPSFTSEEGTSSSRTSRDGETYFWRDSAVVRAEPFDAIELQLEALWAT
jgi:hypothetical protein